MQLGITKKANIEMREKGVEGETMEKRMGGNRRREREVGRLRRG